MKKSYLWWTIGAIVILLAILIGSQSPRQDRGTPDKSQANQPAPTARVIKQDIQTLLSAFPEGFPVEPGIALTNGYKYLPANSLNQQSTLEYVSKKSLAENKNVFADFLGKGGYTIGNKVEQPGLVFLYATRGQNDLSVKIEEKNKQVTVSASYLKR